MEKKGGVMTSDDDDEDDDDEEKVELSFLSATSRERPYF